ncbi:MAG: hypothetical protein ACLQUY_18265 [Ktedonobacterales bacterium]
MSVEFAFLPIFFSLIILYAIPIILGFTWIRLDANRWGQPGIIWAILTIPFGWVAVLVYVVIRALRTPAH